MTPGAGAGRCSTRCPAGSWWRGSDLPAGFDLPAFYRRAGFAVLGPFLPGGPRRRLVPLLAPFSCVALCRAVLGACAPLAVTPYGLYRALQRSIRPRKIFLTKAGPAG